jgi:peptidoglycan/LPS O-acetylase OafA/YrhL
MIQEESSPAHNIRALDGIRGLAIIFVMLHHFEPLIPPSNLLVRSIKLTFSFGWAGVDLFFALSGFLITGILLDTRKADNYFSAFYAKRILRIFPLYYSVLTVILVAASFKHPRPLSVPLVEDQKLYYLYLTNWLVLWKGKWGSNVLGHFWSLAVEEQFYLIWPFCVWLLVRRKLAILAIMASVTALLFRILWVAHTGPDQAIVMATVSRMDSLLCGALAAMLFRDIRLLSVVRKWLPGAAFVAILTFFGGVSLSQIVHGPGGDLLFAESFGFSLLAVGFSSLVLYAAASDGAATFLQRVLGNGVLTDFGKYSYGIYVYHVPILGAFVFVLRRGIFQRFRDDFWFGALCFAAVFVVSFLVAKVSYERFERHFLALKRYFEARSSATPADSKTKTGVPLGTP